MAKKRNRSVSSTKVVGFSPKKDINEETSVNILSQDTSVATLQEGISKNSSKATSVVTFQEGISNDSSQATTVTTLQEGINKDSSQATSVGTLLKVSPQGTSGTLIKVSSQGTSVAALLGDVSKVSADGILQVYLLRFRTKYLVLPITFSHQFYYVFAPNIIYLSIILG